jgi:hypothetical protein
MNPNITVSERFLNAQEFLYLTNIHRKKPVLVQGSKLTCGYLFIKFSRKTGQSVDKFSTILASGN